MSARSLVAACAVAAAAVAVAHGGALSHDFVGFDDEAYVYGNSRVLAGLTRDSAAWALSVENGRDTYFHPLTWLSLMADRELFGTGPFGFHLSNLLLHAATVVLLVVAFALASGRVWTSLAAALLFGIHPLTVEAVAWVSERKTVLGGFFGAFAILLHVSYARRRSAAKLAGVTALHALGLLAKPGLIVLPGLLLALDYWPLRRISGAGGPPDGQSGDLPRRSARELLLEKIPIAAVSLASAVLTIAPNKPYSAPDVVPAGMSLRAANAVASIPKYLGAVVWPSNLSVFHPFPSSVSLAAVAGGAAVLVLVSALAFAAAGRAPALVTGWAWFLTALSPALGLVQSGLWPAWADRFVYYALIGLAFGVAFSVSSLAGGGRARRAAALAVLAVALVALCLATRRQVGHWKDSIALFERAVAVEPGSGMMQYNLGNALQRAGALEPALEHLEAAALIHPGRVEVQTLLGLALDGLARTEAAEERYRLALRIDPDFPPALYDLAEVLRRTGRMDEARPFYARFLRKAPPGLQIQRSLAEARLAASAPTTVPSPSTRLMDGRSRGSAR